MNPPIEPKPCRYCGIVTDEKADVYGRAHLACDREYDRQQQEKRKAAQEVQKAKAGNP
jgi:hypothetical protein